MDPDSRDTSPPGVYLAEEMSLFVRQHFPGLEDKPSIVERCIYTVRDLSYLWLSNQQPTVNRHNRPFFSF